jgi:Fe-S-cluster containining protein
MSDHLFDRTVCACERCRACCKRQPGAFADGEVERLVDYISKTQKLSPEIAFQRVKAQIWASQGSLVSDGTRTFRIGSITPRWDRRKKRCVFLTDDDRCSIHPVAPFGCSHFDVHMDDATAQPRSAWLAKSHLNPAYQQLRNSLPLATHYKPTIYK